MALNEEVGSIKIVTALAPSGSPTASGVWMQGYRNFALFIPVQTDAVINFASPPGTGGSDTLSLWRGPVAKYSATSPGGTGNLWLGNDALSFLQGFHGVVHISGGAAQAADRNYVWHLKG